MSPQPNVEEPGRRSGHWLPVALPGQFIVNGRSQPCTIVEIYRNGANITLKTGQTESPGRVVARLRIDGLRLFDVRIRWHSPDGIGLSFEKGRLSDTEIAALRLALPARPSACEPVVS